MIVGADDLLQSALALNNLSVDHLTLRHTESPTAAPAELS
jgi:hypothetical protein